MILLTFLKCLFISVRIILIVTMVTIINNFVSIVPFKTIVKGFKTSYKIL